MKFVFLKNKKGGAGKQKSGKKLLAGFTLIELMVSLAIFAFTTAFLLAKYGNFNQNTLLTNLAYDSALTIRDAQSYGLNVQGTGTSASCSTNPGFFVNGTCFAYAYGVHFDMTMPNQFILFVDTDGTGIYDASPSANEVISTYHLNPGYTISDICTGSSQISCTSIKSGSPATLDITFKRPVPDAIIVPNAHAGTFPAYSQITFSANGLSTNVVVQSTGEISVGN